MCQLFRLEERGKNESSSAKALGEENLATSNHLSVPLAQDMDTRLDKYKCSRRRYATVEVSLLFWRAIDHFGSMSPQCYRKAWYCEPQRDHTKVPQLLNIHADANFPAARMKL